MRLGWATSSLGLGFETLWARLLVGFWFEDTCQAGSPDPRSGQDQTCPWNMAHGVPMTSHLMELAAGQGMGPTLDSTSHPGLHPGRLLWLGTEGTLVPGY
jgi:hypothetical protein